MAHLRVARGWLAPLVTLAGLAAGCGVLGGPPQQAPPGGAFATQLAARVVPAMEAVESDPSMRMVCTAKVFGRDPATASSVRDVRVVYAWVACQQVGGTTNEVIPVAVSLADPPAVRSPRDGEDADYDRIFPPDVRDWARRDPSTLGALAPSMPVPQPT